MSKAVKALIEGHVQGVWYRSWTVETARRLGIDGWVRNRRDGSVQALFSGPDERVDEMLRLCSDGPPAAQVTSVEHIPHDGSVPSGFRIKPSV
jgi:acylphosphatase